VLESKRDTNPSINGLMMRRIFILEEMLASIHKEVLRRASGQILSFAAIGRWRKLNGWLRI